MAFCSVFELISLLGGLYYVILTRNSGLCRLCFRNFRAELSCSETFGRRLSVLLLSEGGRIVVVGELVWVVGAALLLNPELSCSFLPCLL